MKDKEENGNQQEIHYSSEHGERFDCEDRVEEVPNFFVVALRNLASDTKGYFCCSVEVHEVCIPDSLLILTHNTRVQKTRSNKHHFILGWTRT